MAQPRCVVPAGLTGPASLVKVRWPPGLLGGASGLGRRRARRSGLPARWRGCFLDSGRVPARAPGARHGEARVP
eukprot:9233191-Pyramimonas_sp.AAC.1